MSRFRRYDVVTKSEGNPRFDFIQPTLETMFQGVLADRFKPTLRRETKELPVYSLVIAKNGPMAALTLTLSALTQTIVVDKTGLKNSLATSWIGRRISHSPRRQAQPIRLFQRFLSIHPVCAGDLRGFAGTAWSEIGIREKAGRDSGDRSCGKTFGKLVV